MAKIKKGDLVVVISGRDKGKQGRVLEVLTETQRVVVEGVQRVHAISQPSVSQHLRVLRDAGVLTMRAEGTRRLYALDAAAVEAARAWLTALVDPLAPLANPLDALATEVVRGRRERRAAEGDAGGPRTASARPPRCPFPSPERRRPRPKETPRGKEREDAPPQARHVVLPDVTRMRDQPA